jgi:predicted PurR-regulated permease PerM
VDLADAKIVDESNLRSNGSEPERVLLHMPVDVRSIALVVIAVLLCMFALKWAQGVAIPLLLGVMTSYALAPAVDRLQRWHIPRSIAAGIVLTSGLGAISWGAWSLSDQASALVESLPEVAQKVRRLAQGAPSPMARVQQAAVELEKAAQDSAGASSSASAPDARGTGEVTRTTKLKSTGGAAATDAATRVVVVAPGLNLKDYLWTGTLGAANALGQAAIVFFIALFLLASGDTFRRKMVKLAGPKLSQKKITVHVLDEITAQIQRYLLVQLVVSVVVGVLTWLAFYALGVNQAGVWGVVAGVTNLVPYVGAIATSMGAAVFVAVQFGAIDMGLYAGAVSLAIHTVVGNILTPWWMGRASRINPFAVFVSLLVFGWLWGVWGLLLGVPVLMATKAVCDHVEDLQPIGELLGV